MIKAVIFDFGGVLAEEGFREGLMAVARTNGLDPDEFFVLASDLIYETGYVTGNAAEPHFWQAIREKTGITLSDTEMRENVLKRFVLRPDMLGLAHDMKTSGIITAILSDQTNWLEEMNQANPFYQHFDYIFNSFSIKKGKRDSSVFKDVCEIMGIVPEEAIFVDDNIENIKRASNIGLRTILFKDIASFKGDISGLFKKP